MKGRGRANNQGMVSMMVTLIMMLVISMIVLGFAQISRREQRQSLDRQLSTQAFLAAESGVNDAQKAIQDHIGDGTTLEKPACNDPVGPNSAYKGLPYDAGTQAYKVDATNNVYYTCLLVSTQLDSIHQNVSSDGGASTIPIHPSGGKLQTLHISWDTDTLQNPRPKASTCRAAGQPLTFPAGNWPCDFGVLRIDMVPTDTLNRNTLLQQQSAYFLYPTNGGAAAKVVYGTDKGTVRRMQCSDAGCSVDITNIDPSIATYALRVSSLYVDGTIDITATGTNGENLKLGDAQALIDSTGRAQDILRRIQVRVSLLDTNTVPSGALESGSSICKRFEVGQNSFIIPGDIAVQDQTNPMCVTTSNTPVNPNNPLSALITTFCDNHPCDPGSGNKNPNQPPKFNVSLTNQSVQIDPSRIGGCIWNMDDGVPPAINGVAGTACNPGESVKYTYAGNPAWKTCQDVLNAHGKVTHNVVLTIYLIGGGSVTSAARPVVAPANC